MSLRLDHVFYKELGQVGTELFQNPLGELTTKRQHYLLTVSVIATLFAFHVLQFIEANAEPFAKATITSEKAATVTFASLTAYFFIVYFLSVYQDYKVFRYRKIQIGARLQELSNPSVAILDDELAKTQLLHEEMGNITLEIIDNLRKSREASKKNQDQIDSFIGDTSVASIEQLIKLYKEQEEAAVPYDDVVEQLSRRQGEIIIEQQKPINPDALTKVKSLNRAYAMHSRLSKARLLIEVVFPIAFALFAVVTSVVSILRS